MERRCVKDGRTEAVMWIVVEDDKFLVEVRPKTEQGESICIPCGHVDLKRDNSIEEAFLRECTEEFEAGHFKPVQYEFLTTVDFDEPREDGVYKLRLHYYVVRDWRGEVPGFTIENGKVHSTLQWLRLDNYRELPQSCDREAIGRLHLS